MIAPFCTSLLAMSGFVATPRLVLTVIPGFRFTWVSSIAWRLARPGVLPELEKDLVPGILHHHPHRQGSAHAICSRGRQVIENGPPLSKRAYPHPFARGSATGPRNPSPSLPRRVTSSALLSG